MSNSYAMQAARFFRDSADEMDPDAAIFIKFHHDPAFWLWFGSEIQSLLERDRAEDLQARPTIDRYLHGLIRADQFGGSTGSIIKAMAGVLSHNPEIFASTLIPPPLELEKSLASGAGPHSRFASSRFLAYLWTVLGRSAKETLEALAGALEEKLTPMLISARICCESAFQVTQMASVSDLRQAVSIRLLTAVQSASLPGAKPSNATEVFNDIVISNIKKDGFERWPEWQLLPLLSGGIEHATALGIDLLDVSSRQPHGGAKAAIWSAAFMVSHSASSARLHQYFCDELIPSGDPAAIMKGIWSMGGAMGKWAPGFISLHPDVFHSTPAPSQYALESLIGFGVDKLTVMRHPDMSDKTKGQILSDDLGM